MSREIISLFIDIYCFAVAIFQLAIFSEGRWKEGVSNFPNFTRTNVSRLPNATVVIYKIAHSISDAIQLSDII